MGDESGSTQSQLGLKIHRREVSEDDQLATDRKIDSGVLSQGSGQLRFFHTVVECPSQLF
jgi:hypothetical protein